MEETSLTRTPEPLSAIRVVGGRWKLLQQLSPDSHNAAWIARDLMTQRLVGARTMDRSTGTRLARFWSEQEIRLRHEHLLTPTHWAADDDMVLMLSDLCHGGSAHDLLSDLGPLPEGVVHTLLTQTLLALTALHQAGHAHGDIRAGRLLLAPVRATDGRRGLHVKLSGAGPETGTDFHSDLLAVGRLGVQLLTAGAPAKGSAFVHPSGAHDPGPGLGSTPLARAVTFLQDPSQVPGDAVSALALMRRVRPIPGTTVTVPDRYAALSPLPICVPTQSPSATCPSGAQVQGPAVPSQSRAASARGEGARSECDGLGTVGTSS